MHMFWNSSGREFSVVTNWAQRTSHATRGFRIYLVLLVRLNFILPLYQVMRCFCEHSVPFWLLWKIQQFLILVVQKTWKIDIPDVHIEWSSWAQYTPPDLWCWNENLDSHFPIRKSVYTSSGPEYTGKLAGEFIWASVAQMCLMR